MLAGAPWGEEGSGGWEGCKGGSGAAHEQQLHRRRFEFEFRIQTGCTWRTRGVRGSCGVRGGWDEEPTGEGRGCKGRVRMTEC